MVALMTTDTKHSNKLNIAGLMAIHTFPMAPAMLERLCGYCDVVVLRFDLNNPDRGLWDECITVARHFCPTGLYIIEDSLPWNRWNWREQLLRQLDYIQPDIVLFPDSDESYGAGMELELHRFWRSKYHYMMFDTEMVLCPSVDIQHTPTKKYPRGRHCKTFKWTRGMTYQPYRGSAIPNYPSTMAVDPKSYYFADTRINHYCFYLPEWKATHKMHN